MEYLKSINEVLQTIYLICAGPVILYIAIKGLGQIRAARENTNVTKENSQIQSKREAYKLAGEQCRYFAETIIPLSCDFDKEQKEMNNLFFEKFVVTINKERLDVSLKGQITENDLQSINKSKYIQDLLNKLEGFAVFFATGVADEKVGFITTGRCYCSIVEKLIPLIAPRIKQGYFLNISILFVTWKNRSITEDVKMKQKELAKQLEQTSSINIPTIGTK